MADLHDLRGEYEQASALYSDVLRGSNDLRAWRGLAATLRKRGSYSEAIAVIERALHLPELQSQDRRPLILEQAWVLSVRGQFADAIEAAKSGLTAGDGDDLVAAQLSMQIARAQTEAGQLQQALQHGLDAEAAFRNSANLRELATVQRVLGRVYQRLGRLEEAAAALHSGLDLAERIGSIEEVGGCLINLGLVELERGELAEAFESNLRAVKEFEKIRHGSGSAIGYGNLAYVLMRSGRREEALAYCRKAIDLGREIGHTPAVADAMRTAALVDVRDGRFDEALSRAEEAARLFMDVSDSGSASDCITTVAAALREEHAEQSARRLEQRRALITGAPAR
jgi:tetratricopeptide (TPR) repeat protein